MSREAKGEEAWWLPKKAVPHCLLQPIITSLCQESESDVAKMSSIFVTRISISFIGRHLLGCCQTIFSFFHSECRNDKNRELSNPRSK